MDIFELWQKMVAKHLIVKDGKFYISVDFIQEALDGENEL